jgi:excinuclease ABC subunit A
MDKPQVEAVEGIPPAIAIDQTNPVRTSRSTVGTMTELNDHLKLLFARARSSSAAVAASRWSGIRPASIFKTLLPKGI